MPTVATSCNVLCTEVLLCRDCALSAEVLEGVLCVLELLESVRRSWRACDVAGERAT